MKASKMISILQTLDPDTDVGPWIRSYKGNLMDTLDFLTAGKAIRIVLKHLGNPYANTNHDSGGHPMSFRSCVWKTEGRYQKVLVTCTELEKAGITAYKITDSGWFHIHIPFSAYFSSFTTSDDPVIWQRRQDQRALAANKREILKKQLEEEKRIANEKYFQESQEKWRQEQETKKKAQEEAQRLATEEAAKKRKLAEDYRQQLMNAQQDPIRNVEVQGSD